MLVTCVILAVLFDFPNGKVVQTGYPFGCNAKCQLTIWLCADSPKHTGLCGEEMIKDLVFLFVLFFANSMKKYEAKCAAKLSPKLKLECEGSTLFVSSFYRSLLVVFRFIHNF